jgi:hypothetical protein
VQDVLIPLGLLLFLGLFAFAMVHTGRKQRSAKASLFRQFAKRNGGVYSAEDDGTAQRFAGDFDGIGRFRSPSLGRVVPKDVVRGTSNDANVILFRHSTRFGEGWALEWFVAGTRVPKPIAKRCAVQFCKRRSQRQTMYLQDPIVEQLPVGAHTLLLRAPDRESAGHLAADSTLQQLGSLAADLPFRPEIQVRGDRIVAYPAGRNVTVDDAASLDKLVTFTREAARACVERNERTGSE